MLGRSTVPTVRPAPRAAAPATARGELRRGGPEAEKPSLRVKLKAQMQAKESATLLAMAIGAARTHSALQRLLVRRTKALTVPEALTRMREFCIWIIFTGRGFEIVHVLRSTLDILVTGPHRFCPWIYGRIGMDCPCFLVP